MQNAKAVADWTVAEQETAEIDRQNAAAVQRRGEGENQNPAAQRQQRIEPARERDAVDHLLQQIAAAKAKEDTQTKLLNDVPGEHPAQAGFMLLDHLNQGDGEKHRHRIVTAGFNLQRRADTFVQPFAAQQGEDCRGIGRPDNRANQ